jgi:hypothetical protein
MVDACIAAKVKRYFPSDFGNNTCEAAAKQVPLYAQKVEVQKYLDEATKQGGKGAGLSWTAIESGQFFDWGLESGWLDFNLLKREVTIYDSGDRRWSTSNIGLVGTAVAKVLLKPLDDESVKNKLLLVSSFTVSQNELLRLLEDVDAKQKKWKVIRMSSDEALKKAEDADAYNALRLRVLMLLYADGEDKKANFENDERWANDLLALEKENLRDIVSKLVNY